MPLEPTDEQLEAVASYLHNYAMNPGDHSIAPRLFAYVRDLVLEEAARAVEKAAFASEDYRNTHANAEYYGAAVRAMKEDGK